MIDTLLSVLGTGIYLRLFSFAAVLAAGFLLIRLVVMPLTSRIYSKKGDSKAQHSAENIARVIALFITFTLALQAGGFGNLLSVLAAIAAAATVAVGFGMRDQVGNVVAGIFIHLDNPFIKGDYIRVGDTEGVVKEITLRATTLNGAKREKQVVPNGMLTTEVLKNYTRGRKTKVSIETDITLENVEEASNLLIEAIEESSETLNSPDPVIQYRRIEDQKAYVEGTFWVQSSEKVKTARSDVLKNYIAKREDAGLLDEEA